MDAIAQKWDETKRSRAAQARLLSKPGEPLFKADWDGVLMIHYEVQPTPLQNIVPFELDLHEGRAFVSVVAFTIRDMRPFRGGKLAAWLLKPITTHEFLNVRTYVISKEESGIYFLQEWLSNKLSVLLGPWPFGLPYKYGVLHYQHSFQNASLSGTVEQPPHKSKFCYHAHMPQEKEYGPCEVDSLAEWLMERYTAFTCRGEKKRLFRVWHPPWMQRSVHVNIQQQSLFEENWSFFSSATLHSANFSPGVRNVWMGRPHPVN